MNGSVTATTNRLGNLAPMLFDATAGEKISINFTSQTITAFTP